MRDFKKIALLAFSFFSSNLLFAENLEDSLRDSTIKILKQLADQGFQKIGSYKTQELIQRAQKTKWSALPVYVEAGQDGKRLSGHTRVEENEVILSLPFLQVMSGVDPKMRTSFSFHESCGALGIEDTDYAFSLSAAYLTYAQVDMPESLRKVFVDQIKNAKTYNKNKKFELAGVGGGTGVGGGGDVAAIALKHLLVDSLVFQLPTSLYKESAEDVLRKVFKMKVNVSYQTNKMFQMSYDSKGILSTHLDHNFWFSPVDEERMNYQLKYLVAIEMLIGDFDYAASAKK